MRPVRYFVCERWPFLASSHVPYRLYLKRVRLSVSLKKLQHAPTTFSLSRKYLLDVSGERANRSSRLIIYTSSRSPNLPSRGARGVGSLELLPLLVGNWKRGLPTQLVGTKAGTGDLSAAEIQPKLLFFMLILCTKWRSGRDSNPRPPA